ncbi:hypothetical protein F4779DRAFT_644034 [Xylariaceae sp. FL0662B]|nr:hypothetical protein F4779DRAFT_644034 [Xylariaceae sp. FL0662B]
MVHLAHSDGHVHIATESSNGLSTWSDMFERVDTKEKPYVCHCGTAYARRDLLTRHERLSHEILSPRSPEETQQVPIESDPLPMDSVPAASIPDMGGMDQNIQQPYSNFDPVFGIPPHAVNQQYNQLPLNHDYYNNGQPFSQGFDQFQDFASLPNRAISPPGWNSYFQGHISEQEMVDPALRGSMAEESSSANDDDESFPGHPYGSWMSPPS